MNQQVMPDQTELQLGIALALWSKSGIPSRAQRYAMEFALVDQFQAFLLTDLLKPGQLQFIAMNHTQNTFCAIIRYMFLPIDKSEDSHSVRVSRKVNRETKSISGNAICPEKFHFCGAMLMFLSTW